MKPSFKSAAVPLIGFLLIVSSCALYVSSRSDEDGALPARNLAFTPHAPILISSNDEFTAANGVTGGTGTAGDPYIIEGWDINAAGQNGIDIQYNYDHFLIRDVYVHGGGGYQYFHGVWLENARNGRIENSTFTDNYYGVGAWSYPTDIKISGNNFTDNVAGVHVTGANRVNVSGNNLTRNHYGIDLGGTNSVISGNTISMSNGSAIHLFSASKTVIANNTISGGTGGVYLDGFTQTNFSDNSLLAPCEGLFVRDSEGLASSGNVFVENGLRIIGETVSQFASHEIYSDNLVNGRPLLYVKNQTDLEIDNALVGQLIVANSTDVRISNTQINDTCSAIEMAFVIDAIVENCSVSYSLNGFDLWFLRNVTINNSTVSFNDYEAGLFCVGSDRVTLQNNSITENRWGVYLYGSTNVSLHENSLTADGVFIEGDDVSYYNTHQMGEDNSVNGHPMRYYKNSVGLAIKDSAAGQVILANCSDSEISMTVIDGTDYGIQLAYTDNISIDNCTVLRNIIGVHSYSSNNTRIENSTVSFNSEYGIGPRESSNVTISRNLISGNSNGANIYITNDVTISNNNIRDNDDGVSIGPDSERVKTFRNNFINNSWHAVVWSTPVDVWFDDGYPGGGNYWDNYTGIDMRRGPGQDIIGSDGIGDTPYATVRNGVDRYPLMIPVNQQPIARFNVTPSVGDPGTVFRMDASACYDPEDPVEILEVRWDFNDDGTWEVDWTTEKTVEWQYSQPGIKTIRLEVRDSQGLTDDATDTAEVLAVVPEFSDAALPVILMLVLSVILSGGIIRRRRHERP
jgi:parallel beta-helix repeat protein